MIRRLGLALAGLLVLGGAGPVTRILALPARDGVPAHAVRVRLWSSPRPGPLPLLIYQPGWGGSADENAILLAALAADGFTVAALDLATTQTAGFAAEAKRLKAPLDLSSFAALDRTTAEGDWRAVLLAGDAVAALDALPEAASAPAIGILGWSFGGAVALEACRQESRFAACLNMDGWMFGPAADHPSAQPFMVLSGDPYPATPAPPTDPTSTMDERDSARLRTRLATTGGVYAEIEGLPHTGFTDANGGSATVRDLVRAFFAQALLGQATPLLEMAHPLPGVTLRRFTPRSGE